MDPAPASAEYDDWASIYDVWTDTAPITRVNQPFYVEHMVAAEGLPVELGVGNGRIAVEVARRGVHVVGVDNSAVMLEVCRRRAEAAGADKRLTLLQADMRDFELDEPADLVAIPFHTIGHLVTLDDKREALAHIRTQLRPGGRLLFDFFVWREETARRYEEVPRLRAEYVDRESGRPALLWVTVRYDRLAQRMKIFATSEETDGAGVVVQRRVRRLDFSWIQPEQVRALLEETGYRVVACWGDFAGTPFRPGADEHVWLACRPEGG